MRKDWKTDGRRIVWGAKAIAAAVPSDPPLTTEQTRYLLRKGVFGGAVAKLGHRTWAGDYDRLRQFPFRDAD
jgi:hypothetical protein